MPRIDGEKVGTFVGKGLGFAAIFTRTLATEVVKAAKSTAESTKSTYKQVYPGTKGGEEVEG